MQTNGVNKRRAPLKGRHSGGQQTRAQHPLFIQETRDRDGTYQGAEFSCSLKASLVVGPSEGLHMMKLATVSFQSLKVLKAVKKLVAA